MSSLISPARWLSLFAFLASLCCVFAADDARKSFDIPSDQAARSLKTLAQQAGVEVLIQSDLGRTTRTPPVKGEMTTQQAMDTLLANTGLVADHDAKTGVYAIRRETPAEAKNDASRPASDRAASGEMKDGVLKMPDFMVTGSKTLNADIRRTENDPMPYVVFSHDEIEKSNATNLEDFFRTRLTMNTQADTFSQQTNGQFNGNVSNINLRGLGVNQTLILIDGRRAPRLILGRFEFSQADINGIPLSAIERVEILPSSAGGIYGGGAVGGVINIIRKRDYRGVTIRTGFDGTFRGGGETFKAELSGGFSLNHNRTQVSFAGSYSSSEPLYLGDADPALWRPSRQLFAANNISVSQILLGSTPNIVATSGNLVLKPALGGTALNSNHTFVPIAYGGVASDNGAALVANAGKYNTDLPNEYRGTLATLRNNPRVESANLNVRHQFNDRFEVFGDFTGTDNLGRSYFQGALDSRITLAPSATANPFRQTIRVQLPMVGVPAIAQTFDVKTFEAAGGLIVRLSKDWVVTADYSWNRTHTLRVYSGGTPLNTLASEPGNLTTAAGNGTVNIFRDVNQFPIDYSPFLLAAPPIGGGVPEITALHDESARVSGRVLELGGGPLAMVALGESRGEKLGSFRTINAFAAGGPVGVDLSDQKQAVNSLYMEWTAPFIGELNAKPFASALELQAAVRRDWYRTRSARTVTLSDMNAPPSAFAYFTNRSDSTDYTLAMRWAPAKSLALRASYSTGFLPPSVSQVTSSVTPGLTGLADPRRGGESLGTVVPYTQISQGNPNLNPETSTTNALGLVFTPAFLTGFRFSVDYSRIQKRNEIRQPGNDFILANEAKLPGRVVRGPNRPGDPAGFAGPITLLDSSFLNVSQTEVQAWDFNAEYTHKAGRMGEARFYVVATKQSELQRQNFPSDPLYELVGGFDGPLAWRANAGVDWSVGHWSIAWNVQCYDSYSLRSGDPSLASSSDTRVANQGGVDRIPSQSYHDLGVRYRFDRKGSRLWSGLEMSVGIQNIFDRKPPVVVGSIAPITGYSAYGDARLRRFTFSLTKHFGL